MFDFGGMNLMGISSSLPSSLFQDQNGPTTTLKNIFSQSDLTIHSQLQRANNTLTLGLYFQTNSNLNNSNISISISKNSFCLNCLQNSSIINNNTVYFNLIVDNNNNDFHAPSFPFILSSNININNNNYNINIPITLNVLFIENFKLSGQPFVEFFQKNKDNNFNNNIYTYPNQNNENVVQDLFSKNNIALSARQNKSNPPTTYFSANICGAIQLLIETFMNQGSLNVKVIVNHEAIVPLVKETLDKILL
jgi:hypothetical protein